MVNVIKETFDIRIHYPRRAPIRTKECVLHGLGVLGAAVRSEAIRMAIPSAFSNGFQGLFPLRLQPAVDHARDPERADSSISLWNVYASHRLAFIVFSNH